VEPSPRSLHRVGRPLQSASPKVTSAKRARRHASSPACPSTHRARSGPSESDPAPSRSNKSLAPANPGPPSSGNTVCHKGLRLRGLRYSQWSHPRPESGRASSQPGEGHTPDPKVEVSSLPGPTTAREGDDIVEARWVQRKERPGRAPVGSSTRQGQRVDAYLTPEHVHPVMPVGFGQGRAAWPHFYGILGLETQERWRLSPGSNGRRR